VGADGGELHHDGHDAGDRRGRPLMFGGEAIRKGKYGPSSVVALTVERGGQGGTDNLRTQPARQNGGGAGGKTGDVYGDAKWASGRWSYQVAEKNGVNISGANGGELHHAGHDDGG